MGYVGETPEVYLPVTSFDIEDGAIVNADIASSAAIVVSKTALAAGTGITLTTNTLSIDASQTQITSVGALNAGSITSGFTSIDVGAGAITTTGALSIASMGTDWTNAGRTVADMGIVTTIDINGGTINGITDLAVADGGTGVSTLTDDGVLIGSGSGVIRATSAGTSGQLLTSGGTGVAPDWADADPIDRRLLDSTPADGVWSGDLADFQCGVASGIAAYDIVFMETDGDVELADADSASDMPCIGIATEAISDTVVGTFLIRGFITNTAWNWTSLGDLLYVHTTSGAMTQTAPTGSGDQVQVVGYALTADTIFFDPNTTVIEVA
jgi:hypothetical protein